MKFRKITKVLAAALTIGILATGCGSTGSSSAAAAAISGSSESTATESSAATSEASGVSSTADTASATDTQDVTVIKAATGGSPKPYTYVDENNEVTGYDIEVLKEVFNRLPQYELQIEVTDFASIFSGLNSGLYQIGVNSFTYNEERAQNFLYSFPYDKNAYVVIQKTGATPITSFEEAAGHSTEGGTSGAIQNGIEIWNQQNPDKTINQTYTEAEIPVILQHVEDGTIDFYIMDPVMYDTYLAEYDYDLQATDLKQESVDIISKNLNAYFLLPKDQENLRTEIDAVIKELRDDGTLSKLTQKWFNRDLTPEEDQYNETLN